ncbi:uncharacterized protein LOC125721594 isoform X1 [Brienomyrus brachyistius]|uniref:uncharacterized protein LOC125721475 n=1 Tax=Brienomyrus brachyistius TaxID=42636 RepID=UPI0020B410DB|nr:uncharacterized protein LOC125721475 [Brienomyrus brachyistius]XP_048853519.1 uncharacterized protein LOC125721594 isoform X1 [Brienomyrus brachyistius]
MHLTSIKKEEAKDFTRTRWDTFRNCIKRWLDLQGESQKIAETYKHCLEIEFDRVPEDAGFHSICYRRFIDKKRLDAAEKRVSRRPEAGDDHNTDQSVSSGNSISSTYCPTKKLRSSTGLLIACSGPVLPALCIICKKTDKYITVAGKRQKDNLSQAETLSAGQLLKAAEMKEDTSILVHIKDKDCVSGSMISQVLLQTVHQVLDKVYWNKYTDLRRTVKIYGRDQKTPTQSKKFLSDGTNKEALAEFLYVMWRDADLTILGKDLHLYITHGDLCHCMAVTEDLQTVSDVENLTCDHEECDTRLFFHAKHAAQEHQTVVIKSPDTDVAVIALSLQPDLPCRLYFFTGVGNKTRKVSSALGNSVCLALIGIHTFSGCDSTSAFYGKGKKSHFLLLARKRNT